MEKVNKLGVNIVEGKQIITTDVNIRFINLSDMENIECVDPDAVRDIALTIINDSNGYNRRKALFNNYAKKAIKSIKENDETLFNEGLALKGIVNNIIVPYLKTDYIKYYCTKGTKVSDILCINDRYKVAEEVFGYYSDIIDDAVEEYEEQEELKANYLNKNTVNKIFREDNKGIKNKHELNLNWSCFIDYLCKENKISQENYNNWIRPVVKGEK